MQTPVRVTGSESQADEWALVLAAAGIPHRVEPDDGPGWTVVVPSAEAARARDALDAYDGEAPRGRDVAPAARASRGAWAPGLVCGALLVAFFTVTGPPDGGSRWFSRGAAASGPMLAGEPWRAVTALTLHADAAHVAGNAVATALLLPGIVQHLGPGGGLWLVLLAGTGGNLLAALAHEPGHVSVGASTATFAAVGILAAWRLASPARSSHRTRWRRWAVPIASVVVLLTALGVGPRTDVLAHGAGLLAGGAVGLVTSRATPPTAPLQWGLVAAAALAVAGCWRLALAGAPG
jgi:membrane associated rhomboid family serine protease